MVPEIKKQSNKWLFLGFFVWLFGNVLGGQEGAIGSLGILVSLAGMTGFIYGCMLYAQAKGYNKWLGLLGLLNLLGILILVLLPDKLKTK